MSKKLLKYFSFNILSSYLLIFLTSALFIGCAPKIAPPPALYRGQDLSLEEIISIARGNIDSVKTVIGINIEKDDNPHSSASASLLLKKPGWIHIRLYKFGMPVGNYVVKDKTVHVISGKKGDSLKKFSGELYHSVMWWEDLESARLHTAGNEYIIRTEEKEIRLDRSTLLPVSQKITADNKTIFVSYGEPRKHSSKFKQSASDGPEEDTGEHAADDYWYPSVVKIEMGAYRFTVTIEKLFINPPLGENDFKLPEELKKSIRS
ncbi:MAG TPA: hypothetical protein ENH40_01540 [Nitrospirae bacterium]|nr:hypothetical protein [Nitrospirota bacterium]